MSKPAAGRTAPYMMFLQQIGAVERTNKKGDTIEIEFLPAPATNIQKASGLDPAEEESLQTFIAFLNMQTLDTSANLKYLGRLWKHGCLRFFKHKHSHLNVTNEMLKLAKNLTEKQLMKQIKNFNGKADRIFKITRQLGLGIFASKEIQKNPKANVFNRMTEPVCAQMNQYIAQNLLTKDDFPTFEYDDEYEEYFLREKLIPDNVDIHDMLYVEEYYDLSERTFVQEVPAPVELPRKSPTPPAPPSPTSTEFHKSPTPPPVPDARSNKRKADERDADNEDEDEDEDDNSKCQRVDNADLEDLMNSEPDLAVLGDAQLEA